MRHIPDKWLATRTTLLGRLRDWEHQEGWAQFFETYGPVIFGVALKAGFSVADAEEVVQETALSVAKQMRAGRFDRGKGSFKSWLLTIARSKMADRWRMAQRRPRIIHVEAEDGRDTDFIERQPGAGSAAPDQHWEEEWQLNLLWAAENRLKMKSNPRHYQVFDCLINKEMAAAAVAAKFQIDVAQVYVIKQRLTVQIKEEVAALRKEWNE
jgi:RNA polymerase sigma factor (sigma-70 family)